MSRAQTAWLVVDGAATVALVAVAALLLAGSSRQVGAGRASAVERRPREAVTPVKNLETRITATTLGRGKLAIVEFSDFQCTFSGRYARDTLQQVVREFVNPGNARYVYRDFPLEGMHPLAFQAAVAAECAHRQGKYWAMHDRLFANQQRLQADAMTGHAKAIGLDVGQFSTCLEGDAADKVRSDIAEGRRLGVIATPTFFIGTVQSDGTLRLVRKISGAQPIAVFQTALGQLGSEGLPAR